MTYTIYFIFCNNLSVSSFRRLLSIPQTWTSQLSNRLDLASADLPVVKSLHMVKISDINMMKDEL